MAVSPAQVENEELWAGASLANPAGRTAGFAAWLGAGALVAATLVVLALSIGPRLLPYRAYAIESGSMAPTLPVGSEVILRPTRASALRVGDIITFKRPDNGRELVTHRIVRVERRDGHRFFVTKGDANSVPDAWLVPDTGTGWRYAFRVPAAGYLVLGLGLPIARLALLALIALLLAATALRRIWRAPAPGS